MKKTWSQQDRLYNLWGPVQNENAWSLGANMIKDFMTEHLVKCGAHLSVGPGNCTSFVPIKLNSMS